MELPHSKDIDKVSFNLLKGSKSFDVFPTPVDKIVQYGEVVINNNINITSIHESYLKKATDALIKAVAKVRGLFDRTTRTIYLDQSLLPVRKNFVKLHEVGHGVLPWQRKIHDVVEDDDDSLSAYTIEEFEAEANYFASVTIFQHDRFTNELSKLNLGVESAMHLSKLFGASIHATLRRFVECSDKRCALIVLNGRSSAGLDPKCSKRDFFSSTKFLKTFGALALPDEFDLSWNFVPHFYFRKKGIIKGSLTISTENGLVDFNYHFFNNTYNAFVLLYPNGEKQSSKTKIIITKNLI
jgi:Zn-dependent peptidase ImmA (M78 family)